jgi:hypothetical protein
MGDPSRTGAVLPVLLLAAEAVASCVVVGLCSFSPAPFCCWVPVGCGTPLVVAVAAGAREVAATDSLQGEVCQGPLGGPCTRPARSLGGSAEFRALIFRALGSLNPRSPRNRQNLARPRCTCGCYDCWRVDGQQSEDVLCSLAIPS